ncbi:Atp-binding protein, partial [Globisporangium polare]
MSTTETVYQRNSSTAQGTPAPGILVTKFHAQAPKFTLEWQHLSLKVKVKNEQTKETEEKVILND